MTRIEHSRTGPSRRILVCACGSAGVLTLPTYLLSIRNRLEGCEVTVILSASAARFLPVRSVNLVADRAIDAADPHVMFTHNHVQLANEHEVVLVMPATANVIAEAAHGIAGSIITTLLLAVPQPAVFVPSMNKQMWGNAALQRNIATLRSDGHEVLEPAWKRTFELASGCTVVAPAMPSPSEIAVLVEERLSGPPAPTGAQPHQEAAGDLLGQAADA
ncbi:flavoprotein [Streptomyces sp. YC419]|uniref:Flavoprotein n=1 Tax=Streptomyces ureilyticus TaxID=1775131 RepID=A0ABX0E3A8_9ACTN|nr:flavoprotein [Streptomyces ureilyticus]